MINEKNIVGMEKERESSFERLGRSEGYSGSNDAQKHGGALVHVTHLLIQDSLTDSLTESASSILVIQCAYTFPWFPVTQQGALDSVIIYTMGVCSYVCVQLSPPAICSL